MAGKFGDPDKRAREHRRAEAARRRVRTRNDRPRSVGGQVIELPRRKRRRRLRRRLRRPGPLTLTWLVLTIALTIVAVLAETLLTVVLAVASLGVTALAARVEAKRGVSGVPVRPAKQRDPRGTAARPRSPGTSGTAARRPRASTSGVRRCSDECKRSPKPKSTCRCRATNCQHGSMAGVTS